MISEPIYLLLKKIQDAKNGIPSMKLSAEDRNLASDLFSKNLVYATIGQAGQGQKFSVFHISPDGKGAILDYERFTQEKIKSDQRYERETVKSDKRFMLTEIRNWIALAIAIAAFVKSFFF